MYWGGALADRNARAVAHLIERGILVPYDPERERAEWREHFGVMAELEEAQETTPR